MRIATWNVNSVKARLSNVLDWLRSADPDVAVLQEIKCETEAFPRFEFEALGYKLLVHGQKSYNGVALISKDPIEDPLTGLDGNGDDTQARYVEGTVRGVRVCGLYLPNGNPAGTEKYDYKLAWMDRLRRRAETLLAAGRPFVMGGDFNVIPEARDAADPAAWTEDALFLLETRRRFRALMHLGLTDSWRALNPTATGYSFWDYQGQAWQADNGIRIDHLLASPELADRLDACIIDREPRGRDKASDHTPVVMTLAA
ncbi:exodeoxyribonuclease III [Inquilinus sp. Marseille-Q2685]|uniref:exodeoxyribonuclease III n=1 Tax=Inquilinus sp. Marseille-Q2685 TaxID=2866581 RepID=UPI001CE42A15|nr:exodeoxyribonuclease III [Inquilinus sp. Marseille-Q2685]